MCLPRNVERGSVCSELVRGPAISWLWTRGRKTAVKSGEYGGWMIASTCNRSNGTCCHANLLYYLHGMVMVLVLHLRYKVPDEGVVEGLRGHAVMDVADNRENIPTAKQLHQPVHQTPL